MFPDPARHRAAPHAAIPSSAVSSRLLDSLRGLAALAAMVTHIFSMGPSLAAVLAWVDDTPLRVAHTGRAPVLPFVLSGYVLTLSMLRGDAPGLAGFALRRTARLLLPVAAAVLLSAALRRLAWHGPVPDVGADMGNLWSETPDAGVVLRQALLLGGDGWFTLDIPLWSLVHEWHLSLLFPLVLLFRNWPLLLGLAVAAQVAAVALGVAPDRDQLGPRIVSTVLSTGYLALTFAAGAALALVGGRLALRGAVRGLAWAGILLAAALPYDLGVIAASLALILLARGPGRLPQVLASRPLPWLGRVSFSRYLVHMPVLAALVHETHGILSPWIALGLGVPVSLAVAAALHALVEAPAHRFSRRVGTPSTGSGTGRARYPMAAAAPAGAPPPPAPPRI